MLNEKIDIIDTNVVVTIGVKYIIPKGVSNLAGPVLMMNYNYIIRN